MTDLINPYTIIKLTEKIIIYPQQIGSNLINHVRNNLVEAFEKKCNNVGYVMQIYKIASCDGGGINMQNFNGEVVYCVSFFTKLCTPIVGKQIVCVCTTITKGMIIVENGPINCVIINKNISNVKFDIDSDFRIKYLDEDNKSVHLKQTDMVKVTITGMMFNRGDSSIVVTGFLDDIASPSEVGKFYKDLYESTDELPELFI
jgi:DNA-directed RNA polymerase subunit E'/Rpb7